MNFKSTNPPGQERRLPTWLPTAAWVALALVLIGVLAWYLVFKDTATTRRPVSTPPMLALPPPPPPPPEPEEQPEPEPEEPEETLPEPEPLEEAPTPAEEEAPDVDTSDPVTMDADAQAGTDSFGIQRGSGGGMAGTGTSGAGNASYGRYLGYVLQQAVSRNEQVRRLVFQMHLDVWVEPDGTISRVELVNGSGNAEADEAVVAAIRDYGQIDTRPPPSLGFPARVLVQGRRPAG